MKIKTAVIYNFSFKNPSDVEIFMNQCQRLSMQGYKPLFSPSVYGDTVMQQWGMEETNKINHRAFRLYLEKALLRFREKWDNRMWALEYEDFEEWLMNINSTWSASKSAHTLYRRYANDRYANADIIIDGFCLKHKR